jgi:hypothetical protein
MSEELKALKNELADLAKSMNKNHLDFAKGLIANKSQERAYIDAGYKSKKPASDASKTVARYPSIIRYKQLFLKIIELESLPKQIATFEQKKQMLWDVAHKCYEDRIEKFEGRGDDAEFVGYVFDSRGVIAAIAELNKMDGHLAAIKTENKNFTVDSLINELVK